MRIFIGPTEIAGFYSALRRGLEAEGVDVIFADFDPNHRRYDLGKTHFLVHMARSVERIAGGIPNWLSPLRWLALRVISPVRLLVFLWAAARCDAFIYVYGSTITYHAEWELRVLRRFRRRIIFSFHGNDSRPPYFGHPWLVGDHADNHGLCVKLTAEVKAVVDLADRHADLIIENPFSSHFHTRRCINAQPIGNPAPDAPQNIETSYGADRRVRILHAPSDPLIKGTDVIRAAVEQVRARGRAIEYIEVKGRPHAEVLEEIRRCDIVVDQAYSDTPMALFATEAAAYGKPVLVGSYLTMSQLSASIRPEWMPPVLLCHPTTIADALDELCTDAELRRTLGEHARMFVRRERDRRAVARRIVRLVTGDIPEEWWFDPGEIDYVHGLGAESYVRRMIRGVVDVAGVSALQLDHWPKTRARVLAFAGIESVDAGLPARMKVAEAAGVRQRGGSLTDD